ncbi:hypothetical protein D3C79_771710 [compost metagenome]
METFQQHSAVEAPSVVHGLADRFKAGQVHRHPLTLLAIQRLDHDCAVVFEKRQVVVGIAGQLLRRQLQPGVLQYVVGQAFVLAQGHGHGAGQVTERFAATHPPSAQA